MLTAVGLLLLLAQPFARTPLSGAFLVLDGVLALIFIFTMSLWVPNPCRNRSYQRVEVTPTEEMI